MSIIFCTWPVSVYNFDHNRHHCCHHCHHNQPQLNSRWVNFHHNHPDSRWVQFSDNDNVSKIAPSTRRVVVEETIAEPKDFEQVQLFQCGPNRQTCSHTNVLLIKFISMLILCEPQPIVCSYWRAAVQSHLRECHPGRVWHLWKCLLRQVWWWWWYCQQKSQLCGIWHLGSGCYVRTSWYPQM